jgi:hypothetical protein
MIAMLVGSFSYEDVGPGHPAIRVDYSRLIGTFSSNCAKDAGNAKIALAGNELHKNLRVTTGWTPWS